MSSCEWEVKKSSSFSVYEASLFHLVFFINWNPEEVDINRCAGSKNKQAKKSESSCFQSPYISLQQKDWLRLKVFTPMPRLGPCFVLG